MVTFPEPFLTTTSAIARLRCPACGKDKQHVSNKRESNPWPSKYLLDTLPLRYGRLIVSTTRQLGSYVRHMTCLTASVNNGRAIMNLQRT